MKLPETGYPKPATRNPDGDTTRPTLIGYPNPETRNPKYPEPGTRNSEPYRPDIVVITSPVHPDAGCVRISSAMVRAKSGSLYKFKNVPRNGSNF